MKLQDRAFKSLTVKQQEVWGPIMQGCLTQYATALLLGISRNAVKDRLTKAKKHFRAFLIEQNRMKQNKKAGR
jgi:predicted DNA-binding protein (UPF0251 family)